MRGKATNKVNPKGSDQPPDNIDSGKKPSTASQPLPSQNAHSKPKGWRLGMTYYLMEYTMLVIVLGYTTWALGWSFFVMNNIMRGDFSDDWVGTAIFSAAVLVVTGPISYLLSRRTTAEEIRHPIRLHQTLRKIVAVFVSISSLLGAIGGVVSAVVILLLFLYGKGDVENVKLIPSILVAAFLSIAYAKYVGSSRSIEDDSLRMTVHRSIPYVIIITLILTMITPMISTRMPKYVAQKNLSDVRTISSKVSSEFRASGEMVTDLGELDLDPEVLNRADAGDYKIELVSMDGMDQPDKSTQSYSATTTTKKARFRVCIDLPAEADYKGGNSYYDDYPIAEEVGSDDYAGDYDGLRNGKTYGKGTQCFSYLAHFYERHYN